MKSRDSRQIKLPRTRRGKKLLSRYSVPNLDKPFQNPKSKKKRIRTNFENSKLLPKYWIGNLELMKWGLHRLESLYKEARRTDDCGTKYADVSWKNSNRLHTRRKDLLSVQQPSKKKRRNKFLLNRFYIKSQKIQVSKNNFWVILKTTFLSTKCDS